MRLASYRCELSPMSRLNRINLALILASSLCAGSDSYAAAIPSARVQAIRFWSFGDVTRVAIQTEGEYQLFSDQIDKPARVYFDLTGTRRPAVAKSKFQAITVNDRLIKQIRVAEVSPRKTRIVFDLETQAEVISSQLVNPDRLMIEFRPKGQAKPTVSIAQNKHRADASLVARSTVTGNDRDRKPEVSGSVLQSSVPNVHQAEPSQEQVSQTAAVSLNGSGTTHPPIPLVSTPPLAAIKVAELPPPTPVLASHEIAPPPVKTPTLGGVITPAARDSSGDRSLVRVLDLKLGRVLIDAGHGGHDTGTIGPNGLMEKDLVLDVALRLGKLITQQLGAEVVYTRSGDVFIPLEQRTKIANSERVDLFISIHANSSPEPSAAGVETFYFNLSSDKAGLDLATRENATSTSSISDLNDLLHKAVLQNKLEESREFAQKVQSSLVASSLKMNPRSRDRGVRHAPFVVLIGASMPSILAEIGFVSNPHDERLLKRDDQRQKIAESLLKGISQYAATLSHTQIARVRAK